jgi:hypothetical protein
LIWQWLKRLIFQIPEDHFDRDDSVVGFIDVAKQAASKIVKPTFSIMRKSILRPAYAVADTQDDELCTITGMLFTRNIRKVTFPPESAHSSHYLEMQPVGIARRTEYFIRDNIIYFWDNDRQSAKKIILYKVVGDKKVKAAEYGANHSFSTEGVLMIDEEKVDVVVAFVTCFNMLTRSDSFSGKA